MLAELKFVQGAVAKKDFLPALTHFVIEGGRVRGYNGTIALSTPLPFDIACKPKAEPLVRAIGNCNETVKLSLTPGGKLSVRSGAFKAFVECVAEEHTPHVLPDGDDVECDGEALLAGIKAVEGFIGEDASRPWVNGVLVKGPSVFATNNVALVEYWAGQTLPLTDPNGYNLPRAAVREMLRIGEAPLRAKVAANSVTLYYSGERWLRTQLLPNNWPDLGRVLDQQSSPVPIDARVFEGLATIKPFCDKLGRVLFKDGGMQTHEQEGEGAAYALDGLGIDGVYNIEMLQLLEGVAQQVDFTTYPKPCLFFGERLRGAVIGMRA